MMSETIHVLSVEDSEDDVLLIMRALQRGGYRPVFQRVDTEPGYRMALAAGGWDVIIADYSMPQFSAIEALQILQQSTLDLPFIIVSGAIGEETAVAAMKCGAHDYILKGNLARLSPAVERELRDAKMRREHHKTEEDRLRLAAIVESSGDAIIGRKPDGTIVAWNIGAERIFGYTVAEAVDKSVQMLLPAERMDEEARIMEQIHRGQILDHFETVRVRKDERRIEVSLTISPIKDATGKITGASAIARDITERRRTEASIAALSKLGQSLSSATTPIVAARIIGNITDELFGWDAFTLDLYDAVTGRVATVLNVDTFDGKKLDMPSTYEQNEPSAVGRRVIESGAELILKENPSTMLSGSIALGDVTRPSASVMYVPIRNETQAIGLLSLHSYTPRAYDQRSLATFQTLANYCGGALARIQVRDALRDSLERFKKLADSSPMGIFETDGEGQCTYFNARWSDISGLGVKDSLGWGWITAVHPDDREAVRVDWQRAAKAGGIWAREFRLLTPAGKLRWVSVRSAAVLLQGGQLSGHVGTVADITENKLGEEELRASREQLRAFAAHLQSVREEERKSMTREIHDEIGQSLTGFKMDLAWMRNRLQAVDTPVDRPPLLDKIGTMARLLDETATLMRRLCTQLRPGVLDDLGLIAALEWQAREYQSRTGIVCHLELDMDDTAVDSDRSTALFRIFQEILTNVARHAKASRVDASLRDFGDYLLLEVKDNGRGIKDTERTGKKSLGLLGMRERAYILGGEVEIRGKEGKGTTVTVKVPMPSNRPEPAKAGNNNTNHQPTIVTTT